PVHHWGQDSCHPGPLTPPGIEEVELRSFAVDPQITSLEVLQHILIRAFELNGKRNFGISYLSQDRGGVEVYISLLSDWDLEAAFVSAAKPYLQLKMDINLSEDSPVMEDWDIISPKDVIGSDQLPGDRRSLAAAALPFTQSLLSQVTDDLVVWGGGEVFKPPLSDAEFHSYLNGQGQLSRPEELRLRIYHGGVEPSLCKVVWRYLLNVYPDGLTGQERMDCMKSKTREYDQLKGEWSARASPEDLEFIRGNVLKDVLRTDRAHPYYAGSEDSPHLTALTDLLTTFAITHPQVSYCQGMSDIASPILAVMDNEAHAFICFCGIMKRLEGNFRPDGHFMSVKFQHLKLLLQYSDPEFYCYLVSRGADDLFFCYRWLLLELKREFAFDDALRMLEVTWSSLPTDPPETEVELLGPPAITGDAGNEGELKEKQRRRHMLRPSRQEADGGRKIKMEEGEREDRGARKRPLRSPRFLLVCQTGKMFPLCLQSPLPPPQSWRGASPDTPSPKFTSPILPNGRMVVPNGTGANSPTTPTGRSLNNTIKPCSLPPPQEFGKGNPFMLFLCLSILLEHRDHIIKNGFDYNELAMHFDRLVRRHNLGRVLQRAKAMFADYLQSEVWDSEEGDEVSSDSPTTVTAALYSPPPSATRLLFTPLSSPQPSSPNSTYNLADTIPSPSPISLSPSS
uniref:TBC1 domain family, member 25 n=1 Tax=Salmo trutta TaxID=8032 RepID=A0A673YZF7_SALTR